MAHKRGDRTSKKLLPYERTLQNRLTDQETGFQRKISANPHYST